jgi:AraC family transcriptional regulator
VLNAGSPRINAEIRRSSGATASRIICGVLEDPPHNHDWPVLSIHLAGEMRKLSDDGEVAMSSAAAVFHTPGAWHANIVEEAGCEQIDIVFDPAWLRLECKLPLEGVRCWVGGQTAIAARRLARHWLSDSLAEDDLRQATATFLQLASIAPPAREPPWLGTVLERLKERPSLKAADLAPIASCGSAWLAQAFRAAMGEGLAEVSMRIRVEKAAIMLRETEMSAAEVSVEAGFCDQSHMNRCFRALLGRTPITASDPRSRAHK